MQKQLSMTATKGAMAVLANGDIMDAVHAIGCSEADWKLVTGKKLWLGVDRPRVKRVLDALIFGTIDMLGLPRMEISSEFAASVVAFFVSDVNIFTACHWIGNYSTNDDLANYHGVLDGVTSLEQTTPTRLFALVLEIKGGDELSVVVRKFRNKHKIEVGADAKQKQGKDS
jgi:hypothetical protein